MTRPGWKRAESDIAQRFGGKRVPISGRGDGPDIEADHLAIEVKSRKSFPKWLEYAMAQAVKGANEDQLPMVVLHKINHRHDDDLIVVKLSEWQKWCGNISMEESASG